MSRTRYNQTSNINLIKGLEHIQTSAHLKNDMVTINLNRNADSSMIDNLKTALCNDNTISMSQDVREVKTSQIIIPYSTYNLLISGKEKPLKEFFDKFLQLQTNSMKITLEKTKGFKDCVLSQNNSAIICEKSGKMSSLDFYRTKLAFEAYRDNCMTDNSSIKAQLKNMNYGPSILRKEEKKLGKEISSRRPKGADMFKTGIMAVKPTDVLFFNSTRFQDQFPKERKEFKNKTPENLMTWRIFKPTNPIKDRFAASPFNIVIFSTKFALLSFAYPLSIISNKSYKKYQKKFGNTNTSKQILKHKDVNKSLILEEITHAVNNDLEPIQQSNLCPHFVKLTKQTHQIFATRTLTGHYKNSYDLRSPGLKTSDNLSFCGGTTKNIDKNSSIIVFYGHSRLEAQETVLHELVHSICHRISNLKSFNKNEFEVMAQKANTWIKDFCKKNDISFDSTNAKNIDGRIMQNLDYHADEGIEYLANLLPKISQIRSMKPEEFDMATNKSNNPISELCNKFDILCEQLKNKSLTQTNER